MAGNRNEARLDEHGPTPEGQCTDIATSATPDVRYLTRAYFV
jgi:hypothetical protein